jgi:hypothetical protein
VPHQVRDEDVFKGLDNMVKNFLVSMPLVADLRSPAMRPRHWQQLMDTTKVSSPVCASLLKGCLPSSLNCQMRNPFLKLTRAYSTVGLANLSKATL